MNRPYLRLGIALAISLALMFLLSMSMVRTFDHYYLNPSNLYMATVMVAPMGLVMLGVMSGMFANKRLNIALAAGFALLFLTALLLGRNEVGVGNEGFLRSMIPHHSRAILVCEESGITDDEIEQLCREIVATQRREIEIMQRLLDER